MNTQPVVDFLNNSIASIVTNKSGLFSKALNKLQSMGIHNPAALDAGECMRENEYVNNAAALRIVKSIEQPDFSNDNTRLTKKKTNRVPGLYGCNRWKSNRNKIDHEEIEIFEL